MPIPDANAGSNVRLSYSASPLTQGLSGGGTFYAPATAISAYEWALLSKPAGSAAVLSSTSAQNPDLQQIDLPGTYWLMLRVTDDLGQQSNNDPNELPSSKFVAVSMESEFSGLVKPAEGQKDFFEFQDEWWDEVDALRDELGTHEADTADPHNTMDGVTVSGTPSAGEVLTATSATAASWSSAPGVATAAVSTLGVIELAEAPVSAPAPKAVTRDRLKFTAQVDGTWDASGWVPGEIFAPPSVSTGDPSPLHAVWELDEDVRVKTVTVAFLDGGVSANTYTVKLIRMTTAEYIANTHSDILGTTDILSLIHI